MISYAENWIYVGRCFPAFDDRGILNVGAPAEVSIMDLREGTFEFLDNYKGTRTGRQRLFPSETVLAGNNVPHAIRPDTRRSEQESAIAIQDAVVVFAVVA